MDPTNKRTYPMTFEIKPPPQKKQKITHYYHDFLITGLANSSWGQEIPQISPDLDSLEKRFSTIVDCLQKCFEQGSLPVERLDVAAKCFNFYSGLNIENMKIYEVAYQRLKGLPVSVVLFKGNDPILLAKKTINYLATISQFFESQKNKTEFSIDISYNEYVSVIEFLMSKKKKEEFFKAFNSFAVTIENLRFLGVLIECKMEMFSSKALNLLMSKVKDQLSLFYNDSSVEVIWDFYDLIKSQKASEGLLKKLEEIDFYVLRKTKQGENELLFAEVKAFLIASKSQNLNLDFESRKSILSILIKNFTKHSQSMSNQISTIKKFLIQNIIEAMLSDLWANSTSRPEIDEQVNDLLELCKPLNLSCFKIEGNGCLTISVEQMIKIKSFLSNNITI